MCGISGIIDFENRFSIDESLLKKMSAPLQFRGPDQEGYVLKRLPTCTFGFAHKRLSILDLTESGKQPMWSADGTIVITFNGEIYNFQKIKSKLEKEGHVFISTSDTEAIIYAYQQWGIEKTLEELEGMFAFVLFDIPNQVAFMARDRFGEKPLYYYKTDNTLVFSSDIRSFKSLHISTTIDLHALGYFFSEMSTPQEHSIYAEIKKLPPAHYICFKNDFFEKKEYWKLNYASKENISLENAIDKSEILLEGAVQKTLLSDVPVGCFLSGGLDSSLVSLFASRNYGSSINTFSVGFEYETFNELPYAREISKQIGSKHNEIILNPNDLSIVDKLLGEYGEPFADSSAIPTYYVSKFAAESVKVVLGGDGGDEVFAGYRTYNQGYRMQQWFNKSLLKYPLIALSKVTKHQKANYLAGIMKKEAATLASALYRNMGFSDHELKTLFNDKTFYEAPKNEHLKVIHDSLQVCDDVFDVLLHASVKTRLVNDYLVKTDRATMFNSLELRTPFIDKSLVEFANKLPYHYIMHEGTNKYITKKIAEKYFSKDLIYREKQGFGIPIGQWMKDVWKAEFESVLFDKQTTIPINYDFVTKIWNEHLENKKDHTHKLWILYVFHKWIKSELCA